MPPVLHKAFIGLLTLLLLVAACAPAPDPTPTPTPQPSPTPTQTPVWFPATSTPQPRPTEFASPTPNLHPGLGVLLLSDDFSQTGFWPTSQSNNGSAAVANNRITLSTQSSGVFVISLRSEPTFNDFYAEITASPSLCRGESEYGFVLRAASSGDHYRFALSCDGRVKVDRLLGGSLSSPVAWAPSALVPAMAPSNSRLAVWAEGSEIRFFINDTYLFSITDTVIYSGTLGVFIRSRGEGTLSVSFSDLQVWALEN